MDGEIAQERPPADVDSSVIITQKVGENRTITSRLKEMLKTADWDWDEEPWHWHVNLRLQQKTAADADDDDDEFQFQFIKTKTSKN